MDQTFLITIEVTVGERFDSFYDRIEPYDRLRDIKDEMTSNLEDIGAEVRIVAANETQAAS